MSNNNSKTEYNDIITNLGRELVEVRRFRNMYEVLVVEILYYILKLLNDRLGE